MSEKTLSVKAADLQVGDVYKNRHGRKVRVLSPPVLGRYGNYDVEVEAVEAERDTLDFDRPVTITRKESA